MYSYNTNKCYDNNIQAIKKYTGICRVCNYTIMSGDKVLLDVENNTVICPLCKIDIICSSPDKNNCINNCIDRGKEISDIINGEYYKIKKIYLNYSTIIYIDKYIHDENGIKKKVNYLLTTINNKPVKAIL